MKNLFLLFSFVFTTFIFGQKGANLESIIPSSASMVVKLNGKGLTNKVGMDKITKSDAFLKMLKNEVFMGNNKMRVTDIGIDLQKDLYMIYKSDENITYTAYIYEIANSKMFGKYIAEKNEFVETQKEANYTAIYYKNDDYYGYRNEQDILVWNDKYAIYLDVNYVRDREYKEEAASDAYETTEVVVESVYETVDQPADAAEEAFSNEEEMATYYEEREKQRIARQRLQDSLREVEQLAKKKIVRDIYTNELAAFFGGTNEENCILKNEAYVKSKNNEADLSFWMNLRSGSLMGSMRNYGYYGRRYDMPNLFATYLGAYAGKDINAHLFFNDNDISVVSNIEFLPQVTELMAGVYGTSLPRGYLKYISNENVLGITSASLNSAKFWEAFPSIMADAYLLSSYRSVDEEEQAAIRVLVDFASIMIDEQAMSELMTGDVVFVLKDLIPTKVKYYTYEYNDDYSESKKVEKTKTEMYPDFLMMFGSEKKDFMTKLMKLAVKNKVLYRNGNYYYTMPSDRELPFQIYFTITDDMVFMSTDLNEIQNLADGKTKGKLNKDLAKKMIANSNYFNLNLVELLSRIPTEEMRRDELKAMEFFKTNGGEIEWFNNFKKGSSVTKITMTTPTKYGNSALFLWELIEMTGEM